MNKKTLALILACLMMLFPIFTGCADNSTDDGDGTSDGDYDIGDDNLIQKNWKGEKFEVMTTEDRSEGQAFNIVDLEVDDDASLSDPITKAVYERNELIKDIFNAKVVRCAETQTNYDNVIKNIYAGGDEYDAFMMKIAGALNTALKGELLDMNNEVDYINLDEPWWDTTTIETLKVNNRAYFALGDINTVDDDATWCFLFNKDLKEKYAAMNIPDFYQLVKDGDWTVEVMKYWASKAITDDNSGGTSAKWETTSTYQYGLYYQDECATVLLQSSGVTPFQIDKKGRPVARFESIEMHNAIETIRDNMMLESAVNDAWALNINNISYSGGDVWQDIARGGFKANKSLFFMCHCGTINLLRDMESDFGILPIPKVFDTQEQYGNTVQYGNATCYTICTQAPEPEFSGFMIEALGYYSSREYDDESSLKVAYYETTLQRKATRDEESWDMLDLVFGNRIFDISCALNAGKINNHVVTATTTGEAWARVIAANGDTIRSEVDEQVALLMSGTGTIGK